MMGAKSFGVGGNGLFSRESLGNPGSETVTGRAGASPPDQRAMPQRNAAFRRQWLRNGLRCRALQGLSPCRGAAA